MTSIKRRRFLQQGSAMAALGTSGAWLANLAAVKQASAQSAGGDYKALVCIFLNGGNDSHNTVIPVDATSWRCYSATRDPAVMATVSGATAPDNLSSIALDQSTLLGISHRNAQGLNTGRSFALHPQLKRIQKLYAGGSAAIVANIGPLIQPTTKVDMLDHSWPMPKKLGSHNDQASIWQSLGVEGTTVGWGGLIMDQLKSRNVNQAFSSVGVSMPGVWLSGKTVVPYLLGTAGFQPMGGSSGQIWGSSTVYAAVRTAASTSTRQDVIASDFVKVASRTLSNEATLSQSLPSSSQAPWGTPGTNAATDPLLQYIEPDTGLSRLNPLAQQLQVIACMIAARNSSGIGAGRQVFMVSLGGFDTHSDQLRQHARQLAKLDHAIDYFQNCLAQMPGGDVRKQVTTFTASDFGRALVNNGDGCDHGWGGHHFVIGGSVNGGDVYGKYPSFMAFDGNGNFFSDELLAGGVLLPGLSVDQLVYTLGKWMGVSEADLVGATPGSGIAPNIGNFDASTRDIGFMV
ncbi:hypothetical protein JY96_15385 [Aquabacterium sp. NJ1]|uniref:DUF1501 domain-containing protein n=1 Tax=Aquabacterium sp. NJ1 TaxID=1538295 RepID=UPI00052DDD9B|nr:DUF1501 domain-containing protein [Aquabacterium sp. NJ1]KGM42257.1 hypothetical protein JY96_15385 [Aquabacterium sp. NJ1]